MQALIVIDAQNEFSSEGKRPVPGHEMILAAIADQVRHARANGQPIVWIRHHNLPHESPAFVPGSWGAEFSPGMGPKSDSAGQEELFGKNVYGAFTGTAIGSWLEKLGIGKILLTGFYTHGCVSTTAREAIMRGLDVSLDSQATGSCEIIHPQLGRLSAEEVRRSTLLQLANMGCQIITGLNG